MGRMFVGRKMTVTISEVYDDGDLASDASVQIFRDGALYSENKTNPAGVFGILSALISARRCSGVSSSWTFSDRSGDQRSR